MDSSVAQCRHLLSLADAAFAGLEDAHLALEPRPGTKTAGWLIGHLAVTGDFGRRLCGRPPLCPVEWRAGFNPGSRPSPERSDYPPMSALRDARGPAFDRLWLQAMIAHHEGAVTMAESALRDGVHRGARNTASNVIAVQRSEIATMQRLLAA